LSYGAKWAYKNASVPDPAGSRKKNLAEKRKQKANRIEIEERSLKSG